MFGVLVLGQILVAWFGVADTVAQERTLWVAAREGDVFRVQTLLDEGADPNVLDDGGRAPLHYAVRHHQLDMITLLLNRGADPNLPTRDGQPPLITALAYPDVPTFRMLLDLGADPNSTDRFGESALDMSLRLESETYRKLLNERGAKKAFRIPWNLLTLLLLAAAAVPLPMRSKGIPRRTQYIFSVQMRLALLAGALLVLVWISTTPLYTYNAPWLPGLPLHQHQALPGAFAMGMILFGVLHAIALVALRFQKPPAPLSRKSLVVGIPVLLAGLVTTGIGFVLGMATAF